MWVPAISYTNSPNSTDTKINASASVWRGDYAWSFHAYIAGCYIFQMTYLTTFRAPSFTNRVSHQRASSHMVSPTTPRRSNYVRFISHISQCFLHTYAPRPLPKTVQDVSSSHVSATYFAEIYFAQPIVFWGAQSSALACLFADHANMCTVVCCPRCVTRVGIRASELTQ